MCQVECLGTNQIYHVDFREMNVDRKQIWLVRIQIINFYFGRSLINVKRYLTKTKIKQK